MNLVEIASKYAQSVINNEPTKYRYPGDTKAIFHYVYGQIRAIKNDIYRFGKLSGQQYLNHILYCIKEK